MMRVNKWIFAMAFGLTLDQAAPAQASLFNPETFTLDNGLEVVVVSNHRAPVVSHWLWYRVGSSDSPQGKSGLPHYLEHLMFKGTDDIPPGEFSKIVARNGGNDNALTGADFTAYYQTIAKDRLELVMTMEADRMTNLRLTEDQALPERDVVLEERRSRIDNDPGSLLGERLNALQYLHHPYRLPIIGWYHEMQTYTMEDALAFYDTWYAPNNAVLVVAGDITAEELRPLAEKTYGKIAARDVPDRARLKEPPQLSERRATLEDARVGQPSLIMSFLAPSFSSENNEHAYPLEVLSEIFGGTGTSRLYRKLVVERGIAISAGAFYRGTTLDSTTFRIYGSPAEGVTLEELESAIREEIALLLAEGVTEEEVARTQQRMQAEAIYALDSLGGAARVFGVALTTGRTVEDVESYPSRIAGVTVPQIADAAAFVLKPEQSVVGYLVRPESES